MDIIELESIKQSLAYLNSNDYGKDNITCLEYIQKTALGYARHKILCSVKIMLVHNGKYIVIE